MYYRIISVVVFIILLIAVSGSAFGQSGADVFNKHCASCHGADGAGKTAAADKLNGMPDLRSKSVQSLTDAQLAESIGKGTNHKVYPHVFLQKGITQAQVNEVVAHLRKLAKK
jgi:mono/diheme cytochrome c family protein